MHHEYVERVVNLIKPDSHRIYNMSVQEAEQRILSGAPNGVEGIDGSALLAKEGKTVRMARSMDRPMRYFTKREEGPALIVAKGWMPFQNGFRRKAWEINFTPATHGWFQPIMSWKSC